MSLKKTFLFFIMLSIQECNALIIMLDSVGDMRSTGRSIGDSFERGLTLQCLRKIQEKIELDMPNVRLVLTRTSGQELHEFHAAHYANHLHVDLFIRLHFYQETSAQAHLALYYHCRDSFVHQLRLASSPAFIPYQDVYKRWQTQTVHYAKFLYNQLRTSAISTRCILDGVTAIPLKALLGIDAPALLIEIGLKESREWEFYAEPLATSILRLGHTLVERRDAS